MRGIFFRLFILGLLALCLIVGLVRTFSTKAQPGSEGKRRIAIRFAHWQLEDGPREAFQKIAMEYMERHPDVEVLQLPIPERIYTNWLITQLVGETAPDLIQIGASASTERIARFFTPLADLATAPNPYNAGTDLEGMPLRDTLFDGMEGGYNGSLFEYYGVPISGFTIRMFYNLDLLNEITGDTQAPETYEELLALCLKVNEYSQKGKKVIVPIAGSRYNGPILMSRLFSSQTQTLVQKLNPVGILGENPILRVDDYLSGKWSLDSPEVHSGFELMREVGQYMQPGFLQLQRDDATLLFVQQRALMICTGSWDATSICRQADFPLGVGRIPLPSTTNPKYGKYTLGSLSEAGINGGIVFGITRQSENFAAAKDFLLFLASRPMNQVWTDTSGWIPAVIGTKVSKDTSPFVPVAEGQLSGFSPTISGQGSSAAFPDVALTCSSNLYELIRPGGGTASFLDLLKAGYTRAVVSDLRRQTRTTLDIVQQSDTQGGALAWLASSPSSDAAAQSRFEDFLQTSSLNERKYFQSLLILQSTEASPSSR